MFWGKLMQCGIFRSAKYRIEKRYFLQLEHVYVKNWGSHAPPYPTPALPP